MNHYIGIDVSSKVISVFDGEEEVTLKNEKGLEPLKSHLQKNRKHLLGAKEKSVRVGIKLYAKYYIFLQ
jgi:ferric iron reductase protein FhuF